MADTLKSMKLSKADQQAASEPMKDAPRYPWGLSLHLDEEALDKLGEDTLPDIGTELMLVARVKVTGVQANESDSGKRRSVSLQITHMCLEAKGDDNTASAAAIAKLYGKQG